MKRFHFNLEALRSLRKQEEMTVQRELADALQIRMHLQHVFDDARQQEIDLYQYFRTNRLSPLQMQLQASYSETARERVEEARKALDRHDGEIGMIRQRLTKAAARRAALDKLRERRLAEHRALELAEEQAALDEVATMRYARSTGAGIPAPLAAEVAA